MLDDREQRVLDATAALIGLEEPELAARLRHHSLGVPRRVQVRREPRSRRILGVPLAVWPPLVMVVICLVLVILPPLVL